MDRTCGWGTYVCQDCLGAKKVKESKRCRSCMFKSKEFMETMREAQNKRYEDLAEREKTGEALRNSPVFQKAMKSRKYSQMRQKEMRKP